MRIAVDARPLVHPANGNGRYLHLMLKWLARYRPEDEFILLSHRTLHQEYADLFLIESISLEVDLRRRNKAGPVWLHSALPDLVQKYSADLFWGTLGILPWHYKSRSSVPAILNIHDCNAWVAPETVVGWKRQQYKFFMKDTLNSAGLVLALSQTTKNDILRFYPETPQERIRIVYPGCELPPAESTPPLKQIPSPFFLCVGTIEPRKNQTLLLRAYFQTREKRAYANLQTPPLVFVGRKGWGDSRLYDQLTSEELESKGVYFLEGVSAGTLHWCYENALLVANPSLHEGFGLPVLEAMEKKKPLLLSDIPIFREVAPGAMFAPVDDEGRWSDQLLHFIDLMNQKKRPPLVKFDDMFWSWKERSLHLSKTIDAFMKNKNES